MGWQGQFGNWVSLSENLYGLLTIIVTSLYNKI